LGQVLGLAALFVVLALACPALARSGRPLLQEGKTSLFARVVAQPGARLYAGPQAGAAVIQPEVAPFAVFYLFGREGGRLEVGHVPEATDGWLDAASATPWPQAITMVLTDPANRAPVLFFKDQAAILAACQADPAVSGLDRAWSAARGGQPFPRVLGLVAVEVPDRPRARLHDRFYLMPVRETDNRFQGTCLLQVDFLAQAPRPLPGLSGWPAQAVVPLEPRPGQDARVLGAWIADTDLKALLGQSTNPAVAVRPAVLVTRRQLRLFALHVENLLKAAQASGHPGGSAFFREIASATARFVRDPQAFAEAPEARLSGAGALAEYVQGLPYRSDSLAMTEADWQGKSLGEQGQYLDRLRAKVAGYAAWDAQAANWESLGSPDPEAWVSRLPLAILP
jgi:hypothetical protein